MKSKQKSDEYEDAVPEGAPKEPKEEMDAENRLDALEKNVDVIKGDITKVLTLLEKKKEDDEDTDEEDKSKEKNKEGGSVGADADATKKKEDDAEEENEDKKKDIKYEDNRGVGTEDVNPNPEGGDAPLPQAPAGETDETDKPEGDKTDPIVQKDVNAMVEKKVKELLKSLGVTTTKTPRSRHEEIKKSNKGKAKDLAMEFINKSHSKEGIDLAKMNLETKAEAQKNFNKMMEGFKSVLEEGA
jgi:hypothetical protein